MNQTRETVKLPNVGPDVLRTLKDIVQGVGCVPPARLPNGAMGARMRVNNVESLFAYERDGRFCYETYVHVPGLPGGVITALDEDEVEQLIESLCTRFVPVEQS